MPSLAGLGRSVQAVDYGLVLPTMGRLPLGVGALLSRARGLLLGLFDYEWRSMALGKQFVRRNTYSALGTLMPDASRFKRMLTTLRRFEHNGREEWQAFLFARQEGMARIAENSVFEGIDDLLYAQRQGRGLVMTSCHYDSFCMGMALLGMKGIKVNFLASSVVEHVQVHPSVRAFFAHKYSGMGERMGGRTVYWEKDPSFFHQALRRGEAVALLVDIPGGRSDVFISFLDKPFRMPLGAWQLAKRTGSAMGAFVCHYERPGHYRVICMGPKDVDPLDPLLTMRPLYAFLEEWIRRSPERWLAADQLPAYGHTS
jgi:lauroyl/myristoyl acyltransferase